jgi:hypothetical protein
MRTAGKRIRRGFVPGQGNAPRAGQVLRGKFAQGNFNFDTVLAMPDQNRPAFVKLCGAFPSIAANWQVLSGQQQAS